MFVLYVGKVIILCMLCLTKALKSARLIFYLLFYIFVFLFHFILKGNTLVCNYSGIQIPFAVSKALSNKKKNPLIRNTKGKLFGVYSVSVKLA